MTDIPPSQTLYVNNLNEKTKKDELKKSLAAVFSQFGKIVDVVAAKTYRLRGQAWVVFADVASATNAMRTMQGFPFYDKPMKLSYAKTKSDAVAKLDGTFVPRDPAIRQKRKAESQEKEKASQQKKTMDDDDDDDDDDDEVAAAPAGAPPGAPAGRGVETLPPNNVLFVQGLPEATTDQMLSMLFQQFPGFKEVRMVEAKPGIAFVEFDTDGQATVALSGLQGFKINPTHSMTLTYAKK